MEIQKEIAPPNVTDIISCFRDVAPQTKEELDSYFRFYYDIFLSSVPIDDGNSCPLDFAWHIYSTAMSLKINPVMADYNILGMACRSGQKSLTCAAIELILLMFDHDRDYFHMAAIYEQARVTYGYVQNVLAKALMTDVVESTTARETISKHGKKLKVGTGTIRAVNSFHGSVIQDEVDLTNKQVFIESKGMLSPGRNSKSALDIKISSRKYAFGNIQTILDSLTKNSNYPLTLHKWGQLEVTEKCQSDRSLGEEKETPIWIDEDGLLAIGEDEYYQIPDFSKREKFNKVLGYPGCLPCGIFSFCKGNLKKQAEDNPYLMPIDDVRRLFFTDDIEFFKAQRLNRRPSRSGLIFGGWDPFVHSCSTYEHVYEVFTGKQWTDNRDLTLKLLLDIMKSVGCHIYMGIDFGFNVAVALLIVKDGSDRFYVLDQVMVEGVSDADFARTAWDRWKGLPITRGFGDVASPGAIQEFAKYFKMLESIIAGKKDTTYKEYTVLSKSYDYRFGLVRKLLRAPAGGACRLFVYAGINEVIDYIGTYRYHVIEATGQVLSYPASAQRDHGIDAMGHGLVGIMVAGAGQTHMTVAESNGSTNLTLQNAPTAEEVSIIQNNATFVDNRSVLKPTSVPIDPLTGKPLEQQNDDDVDPDPRGGRKFRAVFI